jgi:HEPN domain-containing protein
MRKPAPEKLADEARVSTASGFFTYAETYWQAAVALHNSKFRATHKVMPVYFLCYHAIELYLKAFLRAHDIHPYDLRVKYRHDMRKLSRKAAQLGLRFSEESEAIFHHLYTTGDAMLSRYLVTGTGPRLKFSALDRTCQSLRVPVAKELKAKGHHARL